MDKKILLVHFLSQIIHHDKVSFPIIMVKKNIDDIKKQYNQYLLGGDEYWHSKAGCRFAVLIWLKNVRTIEPVKINKRDHRAWVLLTADESFGLPVSA